MLEALAIIAPSREHVQPFANAYAAIDQWPIIETHARRSSTLSREFFTRSGQINDGSGEKRISAPGHQLPVEGSFRWGAAVRPARGSGGDRPSWKDVFYGKCLRASARYYLEGWQQRHPQALH